jgi:hypothetical protein
MATNKIYKFKDVTEAQAFLNGAVIGSPVLANQVLAIFRNIVGKTFKIGATTVTFTVSGSPPDADNTALTFKEVKAQIEAAVATVRVSLNEGKLVIIEATPASGVTIDKVGTANTMLGFDTKANTVGKVYNPPIISPVTTPQWVWAETVENAHVIYTWE